MANSGKLTPDLLLRQFMGLLSHEFDGYETILFNDTTRAFKIGDTVMYRRKQQVNFMDFLTVYPLDAMNRMIEEVHPVTLAEYAKVQCHIDLRALPLVGRILHDAAVQLARDLKGKWPVGATLVCVPPPGPTNGTGLEYNHVHTDYAAGLAIHLLGAYDVVNDVYIIRFSMLLGFDRHLPKLTPQQAAAVGLLVDARRYCVDQLLWLRERNRRPALVPYDYEMDGSPAPEESQNL